MALRISISQLLIGGTILFSLVFGVLLVSGLLDKIKTAQADIFINTVRGDSFEFTDRLTNEVDLSDKKNLVLFLDRLLTETNVKHAILYYGAERYDSSKGGPPEQAIHIDERINQHGDDIFFIDQPLRMKGAHLVVGFDETPVNLLAEQTKSLTVIFVASYSLIWLLVVLVIQTFIKARLDILVSMADDIAKGRPMTQRRFFLDDLNMMARSMFEMERQLKVRENNLRYVATHDALTKGYNRRHFTNYLEEALASPQRQHPLALIMVDINKFKHVNDTYGHLFGDRLIRFLAMSLQRAAGRNGLSARIGGDEFAVVLEYQDDIELDKFCRRIHKKVSRMVLLNQTRINISLSMGVATCSPTEDVSIEELVHQADMALYESKQSGISVCYQDDDLLKENHRFNQILHSFQNGSFLDPDNGLKVYFQPKYSLTTGEMTGVEALVRWLHPTLGYIDALNIVEAATEINMLDHLTATVVEGVISALCFWRDLNISMKVAINIPPSALLNNSFGTDLTNKLTAAKLKPSCIELEITEHTALTEDKAVFTMLHDLKKQGYSIAIDDFGVGYANFRNLRNYPFSTIKIDRDFVSEILLNPRDKVIVQATTQIAKDLNMAVIAEGVEDASTIATLRNLGCEYAQGYLFSRAVTREKITELLRCNEVINIIRTSQANHLPAQSA